MKLRILRALILFCLGLPGISIGAAEAAQTEELKITETGAAQAEETDAAEVVETDAVEAEEPEAVEVVETDAVEAEEPEAVEVVETDAVEAEEPEAVVETDAVEAENPKRWRQRKVAGAASSPRYSSGFGVETWIPPRKGNRRRDGNGHGKKTGRK